MQKTSIFTLSIDSLVDFPFDKYPKDFTFIVNDREYKTSRFVADFLSPTIRQYHLCDETIDTFYISTTQKNSNLDFSSVLSLLSFLPHKLNQEKANFLREIFLQLGNTKEFSKLTSLNSNEITVNNVFDRLYTKITYLQNESFKKFFKKNDQFLNFTTFRQEIDFISSHFYEIDKNEIKKLEANIVIEIIQNDKLQIEDEDSLLNFILDIYTENDEFSILFSYVYFVNVSNEILKEFYSKFDLNDLNNDIWKSIIERTLNSNVKTEKYNETIKRRKYTKTKQIEGEYFPYEKGKEFNGIIKYLTDKTGGNIHDNKTIEVSGNRFDSHPKNLLDFNESNYFCGNSKHDIWICFDFKKMKVNLSNYSIHTITSQYSKYGTHHLKSWVIETSNDKKNWTVIDKHSNCEILNHYNSNGTFDVKMNDFARYIRLRQTTEPWGGDDLWFHYIEFFGYLKNEE